MGFDERVWDEIVRGNSLWYASDEIWPTIQELFVNPPDEMDPARQSLKIEILRFFAKRLMDGTVKLGRRAQFFNDDDRWTRARGWVTTVDTVVIHHTATNPHMTYDMLNALGLLRLYCPVYMNNPTFKKNGRLQPISSGHLYAGRPTFVGYHHVVYDTGMFEGSSLRLLDSRYVGFHAGNYGINCRSIGIAVMGNLNGTTPGSKTIDTINRIIAGYTGLTRIIGHKEVGNVGTECPGDTWDLWKGMLVLPN